MTEQPIYNSTGWAVGWLVGNVIYDYDGQPRAFVEDSKIFSYEGEYFGASDGGFLRDPVGDAVGFIKGAAPEGPPLPETNDPRNSRPWKARLPNPQPKTHRRHPPDRSGGQNWPSIRCCEVGRPGWSSKGSEGRDAAFPNSGRRPAVIRHKDDGLSSGGLTSRSPLQVEIG